MFSNLKLIIACLLPIASGIPLPVVSRDPTPKASLIPTVRRARASEGPRTDANGYRCTRHYTPQPDDTCMSVTRAFGLTQAMFINMNPEVGENCESLETGVQYCVQTVVSGNIGRPLVMNAIQ